MVGVMVAAWARDCFRVISFASRSEALIMTLIDRYITKSVYSSIGMITLVLMGLQLFILFIGQMNDIGRGDYSMMETLIFVLYQ